MERALKTRRRLKIPRQREKGNRVAPEIYCTLGINTRVAATRRINTRAYKSFKSAKPVCSSFGRGYYHRRSLCARQTHKPIAIESLFDCAVGLFDVRLKRSNVFSRRDAVSPPAAFSRPFICSRRARVRAYIAHPRAERKVACDARVRATPTTTRLPTSQLHTNRKWLANTSAIAFISFRLTCVFQACSFPRHRDQFSRACLVNNGQLGRNNGSVLGMVFCGEMHGNVRMMSKLWAHKLNFIEKVIFLFVWVFAHRIWKRRRK